MANVNTGLANGGQTRFFRVSYDDTLPTKSGRDLAADLMKFCDDDLELVSRWFVGVNVDTPFNVNILNLSDLTEGGASWSGWGPVPITISLKIGTFPVTMGTPTTLLRYLLVTEVSEIFMRARQPDFFNVFNDWFAEFDEGSKGESLSRFLGVQFLIHGGFSEIPGVGNFGFNVTNKWLNSARANDIETNQDDIRPDTVTGCGTLFLFYLHDQLGFGVSRIIDAGGSTLADVYSHLTNDIRTNAFTPFKKLVDDHYPSDGTQYFPPLDTVFPVSDLYLMTAPRLTSWVTNGEFNNMGLFVNPSALLDVTVNVSSDKPAVIPVPKTVLIPRRSTGRYTDLTVLQPVPTPLAPTVVTLTAEYAGKTLTAAVTVVPPDQLPVAPLEIELITNDDGCSQYFLEGSSQQFRVKNIQVISDRHGLVYAWAVTGAGPAVASSPVLTIPVLPPAGTKVSISVTATNAQGIHSKGSYEFFAAGALSGLDELQRKVTCRVRNLKYRAVYLPPWVPVEKINIEILDQQLVQVEQQAKQAAQEAQSAIAAIQKLKSLRKTPG